MVPTRVLAMACAAMACLSSVALGSLLGVSITSFPVIAYNNTGVLRYDAATDCLSVEASPLAVVFGLGDPARLVTTAAGSGVEAVSIGIKVAADGSLIGGVPGDDLVVEGRVDDGGDVSDGILLTGEVTAFGFEDSGGPTDEYDMRFTVTGGLLAGDFGPEIGLVLTSEESTFTGLFKGSFGGEAKGQIGPMDPLCMVDVELEGCICPGDVDDEHGDENGDEDEDGDGSDDCVTTFTLDDEGDDEVDDEWGDESDDEDPDGVCVEYTVTIANDSIAPIVNVVVFDETFGFEVPGSPIAFILPGHSATLMYEAPVSDTTTNTVLVEAMLGGVDCMGMASATVTRLDDDDDDEDEDEDDEH